MRQALAVLICCLVAVEVLAHPQKPPQAPKVPAKQNTESSLKAQANSKTPAQDGDKLPSRIPGPISTPQTNQPTSQREKTSQEGTEFWAPFLGLRLKITDTLLVLFSALLFVATWLLWRATDKLVKGARDTAERQLRAYIQVGGDKGPILDAPEGPEIHMFLKNCGQTPAYDLAHWFSVGILAYPVRGNPPVPVIPLIKSVVQPGADMKFVNKLGRALDAPTIAQIRDGSDYRLYVWGEITYRDAFGNPHFTRFRLMHGGPESDPGVLNYCEEGNEAD